MHARVVGCAPVPNARPGSTTTVRSPGGAGDHGGPIQSPPARTGRWNSFQRFSHPGTTGSERTSEKRVAHDDLAGLVGEDGELHHSVERLLLEPVRKALEEPRGRDLDVVVRNA